MPLLTGCSLPQVSAEDRLFLNLSLEFLDEYQLPKAFQGTKVGGLSALTYDRPRDRFYVLSDDRSHFAPARFYTLQLKLDPTDPQAPRIQTVDLEAVTTLTDANGQPYAEGTLDPEGIALSPLGTLFIASEGVTRDLVPPFVGEFDWQSGQLQRQLRLPERYLPDAAGSEQTRGPQNNLGFEALTVSGGRYGTTANEPFRVFIATESALKQDSQPEDTTEGSRNRILHYTVEADRSLLLSEQLYPMATPPEGAIVHGLCELLTLDQGGHFLSLERSLAKAGFVIKLFQVAMGGASDIASVTQVPGTLSSIQPVRKQLLLDLSTLGLPLGNLEGMTLGPRLPDGSQSLVLISDDNFSDRQMNQMLLFRLKGLPT